MEFKRVSEIVDDVFKFDAPGTSFFGQYIKSGIVKFGAKEQKQYYFRNRDGVPEKVNGTSKIDRLMVQAKPGDWLEIFYIGEIPLPPGADGKEQRFKDFQLYKVAPVVGREPGQEG